MQRSGWGHGLGSNHADDPDLLKGVRTTDPRRVRKVDNYRTKYDHLSWDELAALDDAPADEVNTIVSTA
jgi:hypothetical protein